MSFARITMISLIILGAAFVGGDQHRGTQLSQKNGPETPALGPSSQWIGQYHLRLN